ncbi:hypothetical protein BHE74_00033756 [Ensete ventricosum]|uniref:Uncharacterized protein n=1 Tax=Ensete ventricosum TaxID=4639 RepID=A0A445MK47_ENSVE|nr:hypothetical protein BHE74_00033756 [Ensete ventricosum]RZR74654.1 hypothetical protein BHM03_00040708 [Ensete ventricosum]
MSANPCFSFHHHPSPTLSNSPIPALGLVSRDFGRWILIDGSSLMSRSSEGRLTSSLPSPGGGGRGKVFCTKAVAGAGEEERLLLWELEKLRQQQRTLEEEVKAMSKRLQATERSPRQLMSFLVKVAEDAKFLLQGGLVRSKQQLLFAEKKRRLFTYPATTLLPFDEVSAMLKPLRTEPKPLEVGGFDLSARQTSSQPEFGLRGTSPGSSTVAFPFTLLDQGFF